jgi:uncharacterized protein with FMN-binding domain
MSTDSRASQWLTSNLAAIGSAAVLTVYAAGYARTKPAADKLAEESERRRPNARPTPMVAVGHVGEQTAAPATAGAPVANTAPSARAEASAATATTVAARPASGSTADTSSRSAPATIASAPASVTPSATTQPPTPTSAPAAPVASQAPVPAPVASQAPTLQDTATTRGPVAYKDGMYSGWGTSRHGDIQAYVEIKGGRIVSAFISECLTQYSCSWIARLPGQVVERQSAEIDYVSGATQSSNALYYAVVNALKTAK